MREAGTITIRHHEDRVYAEHPWPEYVLIAHELLAQADGKMLKVEGDRVTITVENGHAHYARDIGGDERADRFRLGEYVYQQMQVPS